MDEINSYDIEKIYSDMEKYLIANIKRNLTDDLNSFHKKEEKAYGFEWEAWQSAKLRSMQKFRKQNKDIINGRTKNINKMIAIVLKNEAIQGRLNAFKGYKEALVHGYKSSVAVKDSFFKMNSRKVRALIKSTTNDFTKANHATLRRSNDVYRQIIAEASMYNQSGVMTPKQAIKKALQEFEKRGINSIEYSNGAKHKISDYTSMAIRTASTRATLTGEGELRKKIGSTLILMSKHNTACKLCQPWEGKVLIDDVYSGGTKEDGKYPLMSEAMKQGLYHPNCRHGHGTYYPELGKKVSNEIIEKVEENDDLTLEQLKELSQQPVDTSKWGKQGSRINKIEKSNIKFNLPDDNSKFTNTIKENIEILANEYKTPLKEVSYTSAKKTFRTGEAGSVDSISGTKLIIGQATKETVYHEFAHTLASEQRYKLLNENTEFWEELIKTRKDYYKEVRKIDKKSLTDKSFNRLEALNDIKLVPDNSYFETSIDEFLAEGFTYAKLGKTNSPYAKRILELVDKYFKKK